MTKRLNAWWMAAVACGMFAFASVPVRAQDDGATEEMAPPGPSEHHAHLKALAGDWDFVGKFWMDPSMPPMEMTGSCKRHWVKNNLWLQEDIESEMMGMSFEGTALIGYNTFSNTYESVWFDNSSTFLTNTTGTYDAKTKTFTFTGNGYDQMTGQPQKVKHVLKLTDNNKHVLEMYATGPDGKEVKGGEITFTRSTPQ